MRTPWLTLLVLSFGLSGCASVGKKWRDFIRGDSAPQTQASGPRQVTFSDQDQMTPPTHRQYRRVTRRDLEDRAQLDARSGSLWVMEGQGSYLFAENVVRMIGDPIGVRLEGEPREQLVAKAEVIQSLMSQLEARRKRALARARGEGRQRAPEQQPAEAEVAEGDEATPDPGPAQPDLATRGPAGESEALTVKTVPTRVVERMVDGNYRIRGSQPFMIGGREYRVIVSGIVRAEDFNEDGIGASRLLDPSFDIVSARGAEMRR